MRTSSSAASSRNTRSSSRKRVSSSSEPFQRLAPYAGHLERKPLRAPGKIELEVRQLARAGRRHFRTDAVIACTDAPLQRPEHLPFEAVRRERIAVSLADGLGEEALAPILVVALRAGQIH